MKFAIVALLGFAQASVRLTKIDGSITDVPEMSLVQLERIEEKDHKVTYTPSYNKFEGNIGPFGEWRQPYERVGIAKRRQTS